ncbi:MarR family winged helix-turn-helix transcriptional regulator [Larsenimonas salina]|uniref:MarR family winged helix-turn-helix transcriptional regulator n=1 Tax=Larsenimonas salina TaxID=1295565 RepID=UPI002073F371|nr:MarR family transcriptional regulator [Larsenimonas salina]MCM5704601.1 MarR family transcriptional regulator [Larsenimonas salina]
MTPNPPDPVDAVLDQWRHEYPALAVEAMGTIGRLKRSSALIQTALDQVFDEFELASWEFDVLATLRRSGPPFCLAPTALFSSLMITSGTMTNRLKRLESRALIERVANEHDARSSLVQLTEAGRAVIERALFPHVANEERLLSQLSDEERAALDHGLRALLRVLEQSPRG